MRRTSILQRRTTILRIEQPTLSLPVLREADEDKEHDADVEEFKTSHPIKEALNDSSTSTDLEDDAAFFDM